MDKVKFYVVCVGVGGTGSYFIKEFARYLSSMRRERVEVEFAVCDGDVVERKNLERQAFQEEDIGENKALVMSQAIRECLGLKVTAFPCYVEDAEDIARMYGSMKSWGPGKEYKILVGCVDNHRARQAMEKYYNCHNDIFYVDSANELRSGEVVVSCRIERKAYGRPRSFYFPEVKTDTGKSASEMSCGEINETAPQHIVTNMMAGQITLAQVIRFVSEGTADPGIHYFDAFNGLASFVPYQEKEPSKKRRPRKSKKDNSACRKAV